MIKFDHFSRFQKDFRQKMQGLHKIDHNSRKKLKTQGWKTQNSSKKLKVSAKSKTRFAENRSKKRLCISSWSLAAANITKLWQWVTFLKAKRVVCTFTVVSRFSGLGPSPPKCPLNRDSPLNGIIPLWWTWTLKWIKEQKLRDKQLKCLLKFLSLYYHKH